MKKQRNSCERINQVISMPRHRFSIFIERLLHYFNLCQHQSFVSSFVLRIITINYYDQRVKRYTTMFGNHLVRDPSPIPGEVRFFFFFFNFGHDNSVLEKEKRTNIISKRFKRCVVWNRFSVALAFSRWNSFKYRSEYCIRSQGHFESLR